MPTRTPRGRGRSAATSPGQKLMSTVTSALGGAAATRGRRGRRSTTTRGSGLAGLASSLLGRRR